VTSLGIDHTSVLGHTIDSIAWHKAGIFKVNRSLTQHMLLSNLTLHCCRLAVVIEEKSSLSSQISPVISQISPNIIRTSSLALESAISKALSICPSVCLSVCLFSAVLHIYSDSLFMQGREDLEGEAREKEIEGGENEGQEESSGK